MDRREALKKLAVGGAVAAGGSIVLSSNNVAFAQSNGGPPPTAPPATSVQLTTVPTGRRGAGIIRITAPGPLPGAVTTTYEWQILGCAVPNGRTLAVINRANNQVIARGQNGRCSATPVSSGALNAPEVDVRTVAGGSSSPKELQPGDYVHLRLIVKWSFPTNEVVVGTYTISGTYPSITVT